MMRLLSPHQVSAFQEEEEEEEEPLFLWFSYEVYVNIDAVRLYLAGKASGKHAGVWLAVPTVKRWGVAARQNDFGWWMMVMMNDDNGQCLCNAFFLSISTQTHATLCAIG
jgi:hypothetical protein